MSEPVEIILADSNALMLSALCEMFEADNRFSMVGTTTTAAAFMQMAVSIPCHLAIVDWTLPSLGAEKVMTLLREQESPMRVVVCTHGNSADLPKRAMSAGAAGFFCHSNPSEELLDVAAQVAEGKMVFPYLDVRELRDPLASLTNTERKLLTSLSLGRTNQELADDHTISINTVKFHLRNMYDKLSVRNRAQAIAFYYSLNANPTNDADTLTQNTSISG